MVERAGVGGRGDTAAGAAVGGVGVVWGGVRGRVVDLEGVAGVERGQVVLVLGEFFYETKGGAS